MGRGFRTALMCRLPERKCPLGFKMRLRTFYANLNYKSDQMEKLERERAWREYEFDFVLQFLRTVLLKREKNHRKGWGNRQLKRTRWSIAHIHYSIGAQPFAKPHTLVTRRTILD
jgi:hypothetical protein